MSVNKSFATFKTIGLAIDPIHVGTGGARLGRVDNAIVRDPVTKVPKIPGSSLAGVHRAYCAMAHEDSRDKEKRKVSFYPNCAGQGSTADIEHCGEKGCPVCNVFGRASFSGLAGFSDAHLIFFPVATREGPKWVTSPNAVGATDDVIDVNDGFVYTKGNNKQSLNLGWLYLDSKPLPQELDPIFKRMEIPASIQNAVVMISDRLFGHVVNSNLEVRTSVAIDPSTGAAKDGALFTYEAMPRGTVLSWDVTCRHPRHFGRDMDDFNAVHEVVAKAHPFLEALGIGGMGTRGMGRLRVLSPKNASVEMGETP